MNKIAIELVHIGFNNIIAMNRVIAMASPNSAKTQRAITDARSNGVLIDMTMGRKKRAVIFTDSGHIILAALAPETIGGRLQASRAEGDPDQRTSALRLEQSDEKGSS